MLEEMGLSIDDFWNREDVKFDMKNKGKEMNIYIYNGRYGMYEEK
jgi:hypothetical protein